MKYGCIIIFLVFVCKKSCEMLLSKRLELNNVLGMGIKFGLSSFMESVKSYMNKFRVIIFFVMGFVVVMLKRLVWVFGVFLICVSVLNVLSWEFGMRKGMSILILRMKVVIWCLILWLMFVVMMLIVMGSVDLMYVMELKFFNLGGRVFLGSLTLSVCCN